MLISVVTPSYRNSDWLRLCVASVADQSVPGTEVEHIVQDAGSDDGTLDWLLKDARVKAVAEPDQGMYDAINQGLRRTHGEAVAYLNCDEQYLPGTLPAASAFFVGHPEIDVVFGDVVAVGPDGNYLCHRKVEPPRLYHTWVCHLSTLSCGMFFRRRVIDPGGCFFDPRYRSGGDGEWMVRLLRRGVPMAALRQFTSAFTSTGANLGRSPVAREEWRSLRNTAPDWVRAFSPLWVLHHRLRRLLGGAYSQRPFSYAIYTRASPDRRIVHAIQRPMSRWRS